MKKVNSRLAAEMDDLAFLGESSALRALLDRVDELTNLMGSTEDGDSIDLSGTLAVTGGITGSSTLAVTGGITASSTLTVAKNATLNSTVSLGSTATFSTHSSAKFAVFGTTATTQAASTAAHNTSAIVSSSGDAGIYGFSSAAEALALCAQLTAVHNALKRFGFMAA